MKILERLLLCAGLLLPALPAWSAISCSVSTNPTVVKPVYTNWLAGHVVQGTLNMTCTRDPRNDPRRPDIWIGMDQTTAGRTATRDTGGATMNYEVFHGGNNSGTWTNTGALAPDSTNNGAVLDSGLDFGGGQSTTLTASYAFWVRVQALQFSGAGVYPDSIPITLRLNSATGPVITTGTLDVIISVPRVCRFSTQPTPININYQAFSSVAVTGASNFGITCTQGTTYTIALDRARSVVPNVELAYGLTLNAGSATGSAMEQGHTINISVDPGQAGRCNAAVCTGTDTRTLTVTY